MDLDGTQGDVLQNVHMGEEVELLEDHTNPRPALIPVHPRVGDVGVAQPDLSIVDPLQQVDALHQGGFTRPGGTQEGYGLVGLDVEGDSLENLVASIGLANLVQAQDRGFPTGFGNACRGAHTIPPLCSRLRSLLEYQSLRRMKGTEVQMKRTDATT